MDFPTNIDRYRTTRIESVDEETRCVKTFAFKDELCNRAEIGQYIMLWLQGIDEIPLSLSAIDNNGRSMITVEKIGRATSALHSMRGGDFISLRGPYGSSFRLVEGDVLIVGGGLGLAPLLPLTDRLAKMGSKITFIVGAKTKEDVIFVNKIEPILQAASGELIVVTEDGSRGIRGLATDPIEELFADNVFDMVYTCGPELMMKLVFDMAESGGVEVQACFERIIRCSVGLCGSCVIGKFRVCKEGPVLSSKQLREVLDEFGVFKRDFDGRRIDL